MRRTTFSRTQLPYSKELDKGQYLYSYAWEDRSGQWARHEDRVLAEVESEEWNDAATRNDAVLELLLLDRADKEARHEDERENGVTRDDSGKLPSHCWPGGYPLFYFTQDGGTLCPPCANANDSLGGDPSDPQWRLVEVDANWENASLYCDHCSKRIESAYAEEGEPEDIGVDEGDRVSVSTQEYRDAEREEHAARVESQENKEEEQEPYEKLLGGWACGECSQWNQDKHILCACCEQPRERGQA